MARMPAAAVSSRGKVAPMTIDSEPCQMARAAKVRRAARLDGGARPLREASALLALAAAMLLGLPAMASLTARAQEPVVLTGTWVGTWWIGKYEEPAELELTHAKTTVVGRVTLWGHPGAGPAAPVRAPVTGTIDGDRVQLTWVMPEQGQFRAELTLVSRTTLFGLGGPGHITTGFDLRRSE